jgi:glycerol transport system ATP-binding protein
LANGVALLSDDIRIPLIADQQARVADQRSVQLGLRAHSLHASQREGDFALTCSVDLAEISGSETFVHLKRGLLSMVAQLPGVHDLSLGSESTMYFQPADLFIFSGDGALIYAPEV